MASSLEETLKRVPKMVVFDLDYTLWPFWVDTHVNPPFHKNSADKVVDYRGCVIKHYPDTPKVLKYLQDKNIAISVASRTGETDGAEQLIQLFGWNKYFQNKQIYPGSKDTHINKISKKCNIKLEDMIFFDDEQRNIVDLERLGVVSILVKNGMTMQVLMNDYTLWPFFVDMSVYPPFHKNGDGEVVDYIGGVIELYPDTLKVLKYLQDKDIGISVASRTGWSDGAEQLIQLFGWNKYFQNKQIYPGSKDTHINEISKKCNIKLEDMILFDYEQRNIVVLERLEVVSILVKNGMTMQVLMDGLKKFSDIRSNV